MPTLFVKLDLSESKALRLAQIADILFKINKAIISKLSIHNTPNLTKLIDKKRRIKKLGMIDPDTQSAVISVLQRLFAF